MNPLSSNNPSTLPLSLFQDQPMTVAASHTALSKEATASAVATASESTASSEGGQGPAKRLKTDHQFKLISTTQQEILDITNEMTTIVELTSEITKVFDGYKRHLYDPTGMIAHDEPFPSFNFDSTAPAPILLNTRAAPSAAESSAANATAAGSAAHSSSGGSSSSSAAPAHRIISVAAQPSDPILKVSKFATDVISKFVPVLELAGLVTQYAFPIETDIVAVSSMQMIPTPLSHMPLGMPLNFKKIEGMYNQLFKGDPHLAAFNIGLADLPSSAHLIHPAEAFLVRSLYESLKPMQFRLFDNAKSDPKSSLIAAPVSENDLKKFPFPLAHYKEGVYFLTNTAGKIEWVFNPAGARLTDEEFACIYLNAGHHLPIPTTFKIEIGGKLGTIQRFVSNAPKEGIQNFNSPMAQSIYFLNALFDRHFPLLIQPQKPEAQIYASAFPTRVFYSDLNPALSNALNQPLSPSVYVTLESNLAVMAREQKKYDVWLPEVVGFFIENRVSAEALVGVVKKIRKSIAVYPKVHPNRFLESKYLFKLISEVQQENLIRAKAQALKSTSKK